MGFFDLFRSKKVKEMDDFETSVKHDGVHLTKHEVVMLHLLSACPDCGARTEHRSRTKNTWEHQCPECDSAFIITSNSEEHSGIRGKITIL